MTAGHLAVTGWGRLGLMLGMAAAVTACAVPDAPSSDDARVSCASLGDAVPLQQADSPLVAASIDGQPARLQIDTGLGLTAFLPSAVQRLNLSSDPRRRSETRNSDGRITRPNAVLHSLKVGGQDWGGRSVAVRPYYAAGGGTPLHDGMLGADLLRETELEFDLPAGRVGFHPLRDCRPDGPAWSPAARLPMDLPNNGTPVINLRVNGQPVRALVHSGNNATVMTRHLADRLGLTAAQATGRRFRSQGTDPRADQGEEYRLDELAAGEEVLRNVPVIVSANGTGSPEEMVLGRDWIGRRKLWFSYASRRLFLARPGN